MQSCKCLRTKELRQHAGHQGGEKRALSVVVNSGRSYSWARLSLTRRLTAVEKRRDNVVARVAEPPTREGELQDGQNGAAGTIIIEGDGANGHLHAEGRVAYSELGATCDVESRTCVDVTEFTPLSFAASPAAPPAPVNPFPPPPAPAADDGSAAVLKPDIGTFWGLLVLGLSYLHHSTTGFALPALLPLISVDLDLNDSQSALLTAGYAVLYAAALIPMGLLADRVDRPRLLAGGLALWSALTMAASQATSFTELLALRIGFAVAQATQNPICFSLIPELFPRERTTAMAAYNSAIYFGRALSFAAVIVAGQLGIHHPNLDPILVPLNYVDLSHVSILYTQGEMAAITPIYDYDFQILQASMPDSESTWRQLLYWLGPPGLVIGLVVSTTLDEPRFKLQGNMLGRVFSSSRWLAAPYLKFARSSDDEFGRKPKAAVAKRKPEAPVARQGTWGPVKQLLSSKTFQAVTFAAAVNDIGSWALISWQATFYQRAFDLGSDVYAPMLAAVIPIGGIVGGVGSGLLSDWLSQMNSRAWITAGASILAAPVLAESLLTHDSQRSFATLLVGFALSEAWRAPAAIMVREMSPPGLGSTGSAVHLCIRNLVGGLGPLAVAFLAARVDIRQAMLLVPSCYLLSGVGFIFAERALTREKQAKELQSAL